MKITKQDLSLIPEMDFIKLDYMAIGMYQCIRKNLLLIKTLMKIHLKCYH